MRLKPTQPKNLLQLHVRGSYAGAWVRAVGVDVEEKLVRRMAKIIEEEVQRAVRDEAKPTTPGGKLGIPNEESFFRSFITRIKGKRTVEVVSTYPFIRALIEGKEPYDMTWLTRSAVPRPIPLTASDGTVIFRMAPLGKGRTSNPADREPGAPRPKDYWQHPGFEKHTFLTVAMNRARARFTQEAADILAQAAVANFHMLVKK